MPHPSLQPPGSAVPTRAASRRLNVLVCRSLSFDPTGKIHRIVPRADVRHETCPEEVDGLIPWAEVIFGNAPATALADSRNLEWIQIISSGFDEYLALADRGVILTTAHGVHSEAIAQHVLQMMLSFSRASPHFFHCQRETRWDRNPSLPFRLTGQTIGFIGFGSIARKLLPFTRLLGLRALAIRRHSAPVPEGLERTGTMQDLDTILPCCDHVVVTAPLTTETRGMLDARRVGLMKRGAFLYNVSRGGLVDEEALRRRLEEGSLGGAGMDVFEREPLPPKSPWWTTPNVILTPHVAGHFRELPGATFELFLRNLEAFASGRPLTNVADFSRGY